MEITKEEKRRGRPASLYAIKPAFVSALAGIEAGLIRRAVSANQVSKAGIFAAASASATVAAGSLYPVLWLTVLPLSVVWMALNALDGSIARSTGEASRRGALLNELSDRAGDALILTAGFFVAPWFVPAAALVAVGVSELVAGVGWAITGGRVLDGPMPKPDRAIIVGVGAAASFFIPGPLTVAYALIGFGATAGAIARARNIWFTAGSMDREEMAGHGR